MHAEKFNLPYTPISTQDIDYRAQRITAYLNTILTISEKKYEDLLHSVSQIKEYINLLPNSKELMDECKLMIAKKFSSSEIKNRFREKLRMGDIDVNIMTKIDKDNYRNGEKLPLEYNDAHASFRGFAKSNLQSSVIFSAGMNPRLYSYIEQFDDFYPTEKDILKKKITLKVSDYRSAIIQGKFLAKKGIWVSEFRVESGLNCGGHAFATEGNLMGPILAEFCDKKAELQKEIHEIYINALKNKGRNIPSKMLPIKITAQGGVGTNEEHNFLLSHYKIDSVGWGSPFLLVPEVTTVDDETRNKLLLAKEKDLYLSGISPLGVPFHNLRHNSKDDEKQKDIDIGKPGSICTKRYLITNTEFTKHWICTASREYQVHKINALKKENLSEEEFRKAVFNVTEKSCICTGLIAPALIVHNLAKADENLSVSVCPGPGLAFFSKKMTLKEMVDHIYGRDTKIDDRERPMLFVKEAELYLDYLRTSLSKHKEEYTTKEIKYYHVFFDNFEKGIQYYLQLFDKEKNYFSSSKNTIITRLKEIEAEIQKMKIQLKLTTP